MTLNKSFNRPKLATTISVPLTFVGAIAEGADGNSFVVDITTSVTKDDATTSIKTICRATISFSLSGTTITFSNVFSAFPGNAPDYVVGGVTPALAVATLANSIDLDAFLALAGESRKNS